MRVKKAEFTRMKKSILSVVLATVWISVSEFARNEFMLKSYWTDHYKNLGLVLPSEPVNGALWGVWSLFFAVAIFILSRKFSLGQAVVLSWFVGFIFMWIVIGNLGVLPYGILPFAIPLSILETVIAAYIIRKFS